MKGRILGFVALALSVFVLVSCGQKESMDGKYYEYLESSNTFWEKGYVAEIKEDTLFWKDKQFSIDRTNHTLIGDDTTLSYNYSEDTLILDGDTYIRVDSKKYKEMLKDGAKVE